MPYKIIRSVTEVGSVDVVVRAETVRGIRGFFSERPGSARIFDAGRGNARYEIRTFLPVWKGGHNREAELLRRCYTRCLELDMEETRDLIGRAGYALTESSKFDLIIMYFIRKRYYNMYDINEVLFEFDQSLLGA